MHPFKYCNNKNGISELSGIIGGMLDKLLVEPCLGNLRKKKIEVIIPIPPSNLNRSYQPVFELTKKLSNHTKIKSDLDYLQKESTPELKGIDDLESRKEILKNAFSVPDKTYKGKIVLLFDDLYRSGETLNAAANALKVQGEVDEIFVLTITKTRTKK